MLDLHGNMFLGRSKLFCYQKLPCYSLDDVLREILNCKNDHKSCIMCSVSIYGGSIDLIKISANTGKNMCIESLTTTCFY